MIAKEMRGWRVAGLIRYLFGPERSGLKHENPRIVASWDGDPGGLQPEKPPYVLVDGGPQEPGEYDFNLKPLIEHMESPVRENGIPVNTPPPWHSMFGQQGPVWHTPVRAHPDDPVLSDAQWREIAEEMMDQTGIARRGDTGACRWIAVRHDDESIHLVAMLVRQDTGKRFHPKFSKKNLRKTCKSVERQYGLHITADADRTAAERATRAEVEKAARNGAEQPSRYDLRNTVRRAAATAHDADGFVEELKRRGCLVRLNTGPDEEVRGYAVAMHADLNKEGAPTYYSGSKLAPDLSWPQLTERWASAPTPKESASQFGATVQSRSEVIDGATEAVNAARDALRTQSESGDGIAHTTGDVLEALAASTEPRGDGPLTAAAHAYDRSVRTPRTRSPEALGQAAQLMRQTAWTFGMVGMLGGRGSERTAGAQLIAALAALVLEIAAWQAQNNRHHQSAAARQAGYHIENAHRPQQPTVSRRPGEPARSQRVDQTRQPQRDSSRDYQQRQRGQSGGSQPGRTQR